MQTKLKSDGNNLYLEILLWAYEKQENGFLWENLLFEFNLTGSQIKWVNKVFLANPNPAENMFLSDYRDNNEHYYMITARGSSIVVEYLNLKKAEESGKRAEKIALFSIFVGAVVGVVQIIIVFFKI